MQLAPIFANAFWDVNRFFGAVGWVVVLGFALYWAVMLTFGWWVLVLAMHRRRGGWLSPYLAWTDAAIPYISFGFYEDPRNHPN